MDSPGTMLRQARKQRGLELKQVAAVTRIPLDTLRYLEQDGFDELSAEVFTRGFLRNAAREVGVCQHEIIASYEIFTGRSRQPSLEVISQPEVGGDKKLPNPKLIGSQREVSRQRKSLSDYVARVAVAKPGYIIATLVALLGVALAISVATTPPAQHDTASNTSWNVNDEAPKARWIVDGSSSLVGTATFPKSNDTEKTSAD